MQHPTYNRTLKQKLLWHLKVLAGAVFISLVFAFVLNQQITTGLMVMPLVLTFMQLEIFIWLGNWFFKSIQVDAPGFKQRIVVRLIIFYVCVLLLAIALFVVVYAIQYIIHSENFSQFFPTLLNMEMRGFFIATFVGFGIGALFFFFVLWSEAVDRVQKLREEKLIFQYETLKSQVNPHFLFNSLNSLLSLVRSEPELSEKFVQKLSSIYRYTLENREKELVPLSAELDFVNDYFYLQKIRDNEKIEMKTELNISKNALIVPVSLQLLVENALKHNTSTRKQPLEIVIHNEGIDKLIVRNNLQVKTQLADSSKIGLKNLNERCRLILNREIEILETADEFIVKVPVKLV
ncbi:MAG: signal transduction histidine kinase [Prolixibacteraceae bacterium]|nr:MAG: signal transduction histidine kinase [Prolixibacteraceae bacterium]